MAFLENWNFPKMSYNFFLITDKIQINKYERNIKIWGGDGKMFEMLEKLKLDDEYAIINRNSENPFVILEGGGPLIFDRLRMIPKEQFEFEKFCKEFSQEMGVRIEEIKEDVNLVLEVLKYEETDTTETDGKSVISDNTYAYVYDYFNRKNSRQADPAPNFRNKDFNVWHKRISWQICRDWRSIW